MIGVRDAFADLLSNTPADSKEFVTNLWTAIKQPIESAKIIGRIGKGGFQKLIPGTQKDEAIFDTAIGFLFDKFDSLEKFSEAAIKNPVQVASDLSVILSAGGTMMRVAGTAGKAEKLSAAGKIIGEVGKKLDPIGGTSAGIGRIASRPRVNSLIKTVLNLPEKKGLRRIDDLADSFLERGLNVTRESLESLTIKRKSIKHAIDSLVASSTKEGVKIKTGAMVKALDELVEEAAQKGIELPDFKVIKEMRDNFVQQHGATITPKQLQQIKVGLNRRFAQTAEGEFSAVKALVRDKLRVATKSALEELHPELRFLNQDTAVMKELGKAIESNIIRTESAKTLGTEGLIIGGGAGAIAGAVGGAGVSGSITAGLTFGVAAFTLQKILSSPTLQVKVARALHAANLITAKAGKLSILTRPAFQTGRIQQELSQ